MLGQKKRNPDPPEGGDSDTPAVMTPPSIPPLRTFAVRQGDYIWNEKAKAWERPIVRVVEAHGLGIDEARMISFVVFFFVDGNPTMPAQAQKLVLNSDAWDEVEEINAAFPTMGKH